MRFRSWHKWLSNSLPIAFTALVLSGPGCRERRPGSPDEQNELLVSSVAWTFNGPGDRRISEQEFRSLAQNASQYFRPQGKGSCQIIVVGELDITGETGTLYLDAQTQAEAQAKSNSVKTGIAAEGMTTSLGATKELVSKGLKDLFLAVGELVTLTRATATQWIKALQDPEPDMQLLALRLLGKNRIRRAVVPIAQLLKDPREQVSEAAASALGDIGDPAAVPLLIQSIERGNLRSEVRAIEAMGRIGGTEANAYLEMTALGHEVPEVRRLSATLLKRSNSL